MVDGEGDTITIITVYGPNEDEKIEMKEGFWEERNLVTERSKDKLYVSGNFNWRGGVRLRK